MTASQKLRGLTRRWLSQNRASDLRLEALEPRVLLSVSASSPIDNFDIGQHDPVTLIDLADHFEDDLTTHKFARIDTVLGEFYLNLFDSITPLTVANFLDYVNDRYEDSFFHRSVADFVVQAGGFTFPSNDLGLLDIPTGDPIVNEFDNWFDENFGNRDPGTLINIRGTVAMAKLGDDPDSASSQWFVNLSDNSENLDNQNGGFTVFAEVLFDGMTVVDAIAALPTEPFDDPFSNLPLRNYTSGSGDTILKEHLAIIDRVVANDLRFEVIANDNPTVLNAVIHGGAVTVEPTGLGGGFATITVRATDLEDDTTANQTFTVSVDGPPIAHDDRGTNVGDNPIVINVLDNDINGSDVIDPTTVTIVDQPIHGTATANAVTGVITYTPGTTFTETDSFTYHLADATGRTSNTATVSVSVATAPVAHDDEGTSDVVAEPIVIDVLANDSDLNGNDTIDPATVTIINGPADGIVQIDPDSGMLTYIPNGTLGGDDSFTYTVADSTARVSNPATVHISVQITPVANDDTVSVDIPVSTIEIDVLNNDTDDNGNNTLELTTVTIVDGPTQGTTTLDAATGVVTYTPNTEIATVGGNDSFAYTVADETGRLSDPATVDIAIEAPPVASDDEVTNDVLAEPILINVLDNDTDSNGDETIDPTTISIVDASSKGDVEIDSDNGGIIYTPGADFLGDDLFTYTISDETGRISNVATVTIAVHLPPVANDDNQIINLNLDPVIIDVLDNDIDENGDHTIDPTSVTIIDTPVAGVIVIDPDTGVVTYTPGNDFDGSDVFSYTVTDTTGLLSPVAEVVVAFTPGTSFGAFADDNPLTIAINGVDVTFTIDGAGHGEVLAAGGQHMDVILTGTNLDSVVPITTGSDAERFVVHDITADGTLGALIARTTDLSGDIDILGTAKSIILGNVADNHTISIGAPLDPTTTISMLLGNVIDLVINSDTAFKSITTNGWSNLDGINDQINAPSVQSLISHGDFEANLNLDGSAAAALTLGTATIRGTLKGAEWTIAGSTGPLTAGDVSGFTLDVNRLGYVNAAVHSLKFDTVANNTSVDVNGHLGPTTAVSWDGGSIKAKSATSITMRGDPQTDTAGDFKGRVTLSGDPSVRRVLGMARIAGTVHGRKWEIAGDVGRLTAAAWTRGAIDAASIQALNITGDKKANTRGAFAVDLTLSGSTKARKRLGRAKIKDRLLKSTWTIDGEIGPLRVPNVDAWDLNLESSLKSLKVGNVTKTNLDVAGDIGAITVIEWSEGSIHARSLRSIRTRSNWRTATNPKRVKLGNFDADVTLDGQTNATQRLGNVKIKGLITGGDWLIEGSAGNITAARWLTGTFTAASLNTLIIKGNPLLGITGSLDADLKLTGPTDEKLRLRRARIDGTISNCTWYIAGPTGPIDAGATSSGWAANILGSVKSFTTAGNMSGTIAAASFGSIKVGYDMRGAILLAGANLGEDAAITGTGENTDTFGAGAVGKVRVANLMIDSVVGAGLDPVNNVFNDGDDAIVGGTASFVNSIVVGGKISASSLFAAGAYPPHVMIDGHRIDPATSSRFLHV